VFNNLIIRYKNVECLIKENRDNLILKMVRLSRISKVKLLPFFDEPFHLASLEMFAGKPQVKPHALLVCSLGMFWPEALCSRNARWQPGKLSREGAVQALCRAETVPLLCKVSLLKKNGNSFHLETNGSQDHAALTMAFLKTARKPAKIEAVRRKYLLCVSILVRRKETGRNKEMAESVSELGCTSERH